jgi:hypothetical protein
MPTPRQPHRGHHPRERAGSVDDMKYLLRALLVAALPYLVRAIAKRLNAPVRAAGGASRLRRPVVIEGEKLS